MKHCFGFFAVLLSMQGMLSGVALASTAKCIILDHGTTNRDDDCSVTRIDRADKMAHYEISSKYGRYYLHQSNCSSSGSSCKYQMGDREDKNARGYSEASKEFRQLASPSGRFSTRSFECFRQRWSGSLHICLESGWD